MELCKLQLKAVPELHREELVEVKSAAIDVKSFHIWGSQDQLVEPWRSRKLSESFKDPVVAIHPALRTFTSPY